LGVERKQEKVSRSANFLGAQIWYKSDSGASLIGSHSTPCHLTTTKPRNRTFDSDQLTTALVGLHFSHFSSNFLPTQFFIQIT